jgi:gliding motility-associated-like protein
MKIKFAVVILFAGIGFSLYAQSKRSGHWFFGSSAGLDFSSGSPVANISGNLNSIEGCCSISDPAGNLLFYSNGEKVWNSAGVLMPNSAGLNGDQSSAQSSIIVPSVSNTSQYYLFSSSGITPAGFYYSIIDMTLNFGSGDIMPGYKNVPVSSSNTEEVAATRNCNARDYWIVKRIPATNILLFHAYPITSSGLGNPVISSFAFPNSLNNLVGGLTFSQDGSRLAFSSFGTAIYIFNFDNGTGQLSVPASIQPYAYETVYSNALSPDKTKLYISTWVFAPSGTPNKKCYLSQFDLAATDVGASRKNIDSTYYNGSEIGYGYIGQIRLASDQKIYVSRWSVQPPYINNTPGFSLDSLGAINFPDLAGAGSGYVQNAVYLNQKPTMLGLPNFVSNFTADFQISPAPILQLSNVSICRGNSAILTINNPADPGLTYTWIPGNTTGTSVVVSPSATSIYTLLTQMNGCTLSFRDTVFVNTPVITVNNPTICVGASTVLTASGAFPDYTYTWQPVASNSFSILVAPLSTSIYTVNAGFKGCTTVTTGTVTVRYPPTLSVNNPTIRCSGGSATLIANSTPSANVSYKWSAGTSLTNTLFLNVASTSVCTVTAGINGCTISATATITVKSPTAAVTGFSYPEPFCAGTADVLPENVTGFTPGGKYFSTGLILDSITGKIDLSASPPGTYDVIYSVPVTNCNLSDSSKAAVTIYPRPKADFDFSPQSPLVNTDQVIFTDASTGEAITQWSWFFIDNNGHRSNNKKVPYVFTEAGAVPIALVISNTWGCVDSIVKVVHVDPDFAVYIPNAFTPNKDGRNELFGPVMTGVKNFTFAIFDRWGEKILETNNADRSWDGEYKGESCKQDIYVWKLSLLTESNLEKNLTGHVLLYR